MVDNATNSKGADGAHCQVEGDEGPSVEENEVEDQSDSANESEVGTEKSNEALFDPVEQKELKSDNSDNKKEMPDTNSFMFKDVEESLEAFNGESGKDVVVWLKNFEDIANVCSWNDVQRYLYARRLLRGAAKLSVEASTGVHKWADLKEYLKREFSLKATSINIHRTLESRKKERGETYLEYMYTMKAIANRGRVDEESLIVYIVAGIADEVVNKTVLYEAKTFDELKEKFKVYETMKSQGIMKRNPKPDQKSSYKERPNQPNQRNTRCFNCGSKSHFTSSCTHKARGARCFKCGEFGHMAPDCTRPRNDSRYSLEKSQVNMISTPDLHIRVKLNGKEFLALLDTGSDVTLIRNSIKNTLQIPENNEGPGKFLTGFGQHVKRTLCSFEAPIQINNEEYPVRFHVVPDLWLSRDILIGKDILKDATLVISKGKVTLQKDRISEVREDENNFLEKFEVVQLIEEAGIDSVNEIMDEDLRCEVKSLIDGYTPIKPSKSCVEMSITLEDEKPIYQKPRRLAPQERLIVSKQVEQWLEEGIIRHSRSDFASPIVLARKKDGTHRLCIDYRKLNQKILKDRYPLPVIEELLEDLHDARVFTTLDLRNGFFHVDIKDESCKYTAFTTPDGQFEFLKAPFGLCNSPAIFQRFINTIFQPLIRKGVLLVYMDDIIIPSASERENLDKLRLTLEVAQNHGLIIKWSKCKFLKRSIEFLGHVLESGCIKPSIEKISAVKHFPVPRNLKQVQSFLGLTGFFRKFVPNYSTIAKPLTDLLKSEVPFVFNSEQQDAFMLLKERLCSDPVLKLFNPKLETELHTDASKEGFGAVLLQRHLEDNKFHPVFYLSFKTNSAEKNYSSYELEVLAIIKALRKLRPYLLGLEFKVVTDCKAFQLTMKKKELSSRVARWALLLEEFNCSVQHRSGSTMRHVDALSRHPAVYSIGDGVLEQIRKAQEKDETCQLIATILREKEYEGYTLRNGVLFKFADGNFLLVVPKALQREIVKNVHEQGHINGRKVESIVKQEYYIPKLGKRIESVIANCVQCILASRKLGKQEGLLNPIEKGDIPLHTYHVDHLGPLASTAKNYKYLFVVIDSFTKFSWIYPVKSTTTDEALKRLELQSEVFGNPYRIVADKGSTFTSRSFRAYCEQQKINLVLVTAGVPRGNGQVERLNETIISVLTKLSLDDPQKWYRHVSNLQRFLNSTVSRATGKTPFELLIGTKMRRPEDHNLSKILEEEIQAKFEESRDEARQLAKEQIRKIQEENRRYSRRKRKPARVYRVHDLVAIKRTQFTPGSKLYPKFLGPYEVTSVNGKDRYDLKKVGNHEGPNFTTSAADHMKAWSMMETDSSSDSEDIQDGRMWEQNQKRFDPPDDGDRRSTVLLSPPNQQLAKEERITSLTDKLCTS